MYEVVKDASLVDIGSAVDPAASSYRTMPRIVSLMSLLLLLLWGLQPIWNITLIELAFGQEFADYNPEPMTRR